MPYTTLQWTRFLEAIGRGYLLGLDWVKDPVQRSANVEALYKIIADAAPSKTTEEWLGLLREREIPCGRANSLDDLFDEPHLEAVGLFEDVAHPSEGAMRAVRSPLRVLGVPKHPDRPAPRLGESSEALLLEAGFSAAEVRQLVTEGVVRTTAACDSPSAKAPDFP